MEQKSSKIIMLPSDKERLEQLEKKLHEYKKRLSEERPFGLNDDTTCKIIILEELLTEHIVERYQIRRKVVERLGTRLNPFTFDNAWGVIEDYCLTGGKYLSNGNLPTAQ